MNKYFRIFILQIISIKSIATLIQLFLHSSILLIFNILLSTALCVDLNFIFPTLVSPCFWCLHDSRNTHWLRNPFFRHMGKLLLTRWFNLPKDTHPNSVHCSISLVGVLVHMVNYFISYYYISSCDGWKLSSFG